MIQKFKLDAPYAIGPFKYHNELKEAVLSGIVNQTEIAEFDIKEGDILTFPSFVIHRAPINTNTHRKTIISWNMDTELTPGIYKE